MSNIYLKSTTEKNWRTQNFDFLNLIDSSPGQLLGSSNLRRYQKIPHTLLKRRTLCFSSYNNRELKVKLWWVGALERKKRTFSVPLILSERNFINMCLSQCMVYWINFQNIHTFTYQKHYFIHFCRLFLKSSKAFSVSLAKYNLFCQEKMLVPDKSTYSIIKVMK